MLGSVMVTLKGIGCCTCDSKNRLSSKQNYFSRSSARPLFWNTIQYNKKYNKQKQQRKEIQFYTEHTKEIDILHYTMLFIYWKCKMEMLNIWFISWTEYGKFERERW